MIIKRSSIFMLSFPIIVFGFYIGPVRSDQLMIIFLALLSFSKQTIIIKKREFLVLTFITLFICIGLMSFFLSKNFRDIMLTISQTQNYVELALIYLIWINFIKHKDKEYILKLLKAFLYSMVLVTFLTIFVYFYGFEILGIFNNTEVAHMENVSLLSLLVNSGRYPGTFGQIMEAGVAYSLAYLLIVYLKNDFKNQLFYYLILIFLLFGGFMTGSKIFIGNFILISLYGAYRYRSFFTILFLSLVPVSYSIYNFANILPWQFKRLFVNIDAGTFFHLYTSGRFTENSAIVAGMERLLNENAIFGEGFGYLRTSDFSLYEVLSIAGLSGIILYFLVIFFVYAELQFRRKFWYVIFVYFFIITVSISAPAITGNKIGYIMLICFLSLGKIMRKDENSSFRQ